MAQDLTKVLIAFHRDVLLPDVKRIVKESTDELRQEMAGHFDALYQRMGRLEDEYQMLVVGLRRVEDRLALVEDRLGLVEERLGRVEAELAALKERVTAIEKVLRVSPPMSGDEREGLRAEIRALTARVSILESQVIAIESRLGSRDPGT